MQSVVYPEASALLCLILVKLFFYSLRRNSI